MRHDHAVDSGLDHTAMHHLEALEPRLLLTTISGGETFQFTDVHGQLVQVTVSGDALVELIGAAADGTNITLGDLPGLFVNSELGRNGVDYLLDGSEVIANSWDIDDPFYNAGDVNNVGDFGDQIDLQGLASQDPLFGGSTYAFNVASINDNLLVQLLLHSTTQNATGGTVQAMLQQATLGLDQGSALTASLGTAPTALAFDAADTRLLYAVTETGTGSNLWSINRLTGSVTDLGAIENTDTGNQLTNVQAIGFDGAGQMYLLTHDYDGDPTTNTSGDATDGGTLLDGAIVAVDKTNGDFANADATTLFDPSAGGAEPNEVYSAMTFDADSGNWLAVARRVDGSGNVTSVMQELTPLGQITQVGQIQADGGATAIDGITFVTDSDGDRMLVGLDNSQADDDSGTVRPRMVRINTNNANAALLSQASVNGTVQGVFGDIAAVDETGSGQWVLYGVDADEIYRGSAVTLPLNAEAASTVSAIEGADFRPLTGDPEDGLLYFVVRAEVPLGEETGDAFDVYTVDVNAGSYSAVQSSLTRVGRLTGFVGGNADVTSIAWDQTAADDARLLFSVITEDGNGDDQGRIWSWNGTATTGGPDGVDLLTTGTVATMSLFGSPVLTVTGISVVNDDPAAADGTILGIVNDDGQDLLVSIDLASGVLSPLGDTTDIDDGDDPIIGQDLEGLTWNPTVFNPFTGEVGALLATDVASDVLVVLDTRFRAADQLFSIYVSHASADAQISISTYHQNNDNAVQTPYSGVTPLDEDGNNAIVVSSDARYDLQIDPANTDQTIVKFSDGVGGAFVGVRQWVFRDQNANEREPLRPVVSDDLAAQLGMFASGIDTAPDGVLADPNRVGAGVFIEHNLLDFFIDQGVLTMGDRTMGGNLDRLTAISVRNDLAGNGAIIVIDNDNIDENGDPTGSELGVIDPDTGRATDAISIINPATGTPITVMAAAWGWENLDFAGNEALYGIAEINNPAPELDADDVAGNLGDIMAGGEFHAMTVGSSGIVYAVVESAGEFNVIAITRDINGAVSSVQTLGHIVDGDDSFVDIEEVHALDFDSTTGTLYMIGDHAGADTALFTLQLAPVDADDDDVVEELIATQVADMADGGDPIVDMAFSPDGDLYIVRSDGATSSLIEVNLADGNETVIGAIQEGGVTDLVIGGIDFDDTGLLLGVDTGADRVVVIDIVDPTDSREYTIPGTVAANMLGYASDPSGTFFGIALDDSGADETLLTSPGLTRSIGTINTTTGEFSIVAQLTGALATSGVQAMTFAPLESPNFAGQQALVVLGQDGQLHDLDPLTGTIGGSVAIEDGDGNAVTGIGSIAFNRFGNILLAHDKTNGRLIDLDFEASLGNFTTLNPVVAGEQITTADGSVRPTVAGIAYDVTNDRFLAADNATGFMSIGAGEAAATNEAASLMILKNFTGTSTAIEIQDADASQDMGNVLIGGALTGLFDASGSVNMLYAGAILTGQSSGQFEGAPDRPGNVAVAGDLRNIISGSSFGTNLTVDSTEPVYFTGFDLDVEGQVGQIWSLDGFIGTFNIANNENIPTITSAFEELEGRQIVDGLAAVQEEWFAGRLYDGTEKYYNDTFETAQRIGTIRSLVDGDLARSIISGTLDGFEPANDPVDYYAISLMAGQTVEFQLDPLGLLPVAVGIYDPDGRLIATNYNAIDSGVTYFEPFRVTTDRPGEYRIAVTSTTNPDFADDPELLAFAGYRIFINDVGELALGAIRAEGNLLTVHDQVSYSVQHADLGAISTGGSTWFDGLSDRHINVADGNLRALVAGDDIASDDEGLIAFWPRIEVRGGGIGLMRAGGSVLFSQTGDPIADQAWVDGDIQYVDAAEQYGGFLFTNQGIGNVRAGTMTVLGGFEATFFRANADETGNDGVIDLIDVTGDMGTLAGGGPGIDTGAGGNVRYMRVGGTIYQDIQFLGGGYSPMTLNPGETFLHVDDGGGRVELTPDLIQNPAYDSELPIDPDTNPQFIGGAMTIRQYAIRGSGGSVLVDVTVDQFSLNIQTLSNNPVSHPVQIGAIVLGGTGHAVVTDEQTGELVLQEDDTIEDVAVVINGSLDVDVLDVTGGVIDHITNNTHGEIVSVTAASVGTIRTTGRLGVPRSSTGALVNPITVINAVYPFNQQSTGINISGDVVNIYASEGLGNLMIGGTVQRIHANYDDADDGANLIEGVLAPIYVGTELRRINIGEAIAPSGSGYHSRAGIYVEGPIGTVTNQTGGDVFGDIISTTSIDLIELNDGSLINTQVATYTELEMATALPNEGVIGEFDDIIELGRLELWGDGGIIGSNIVTGDMGQIIVHGFGIFESTILNVGSNEIESIRADGFGILGTNVQAARSLGTIEARGDGEPLTIDAFDENIRHALTGLEYHPVFQHVRLTELTDVARAFAVSPAGAIDGAGYQHIAGQFNQLDVQGVVDLGKAEAHRMVDTFIDFANSIGTIETGESVDGDPTTINGLTVTTGYLKKFKPGADVSNLDLTVAGRIKKIRIDGNLLGSSIIRAVGPNGNIKKVDIRGNLEGSLFADGYIDKVRVRGYMEGDITVEGNGVEDGDEALDYLRIDQYFNGSITVLNGDVGRIRTELSFGDTTTDADQLYIAENLDRLEVGDHDNATTDILAANVIVMGHVDRIEVEGQIGGAVGDPEITIFIGGNLDRLRIERNTEDVGNSDSLFNGSLTVGGRLDRIDVEDGNLGDGGTAWSITAGDTIERVDIDNGSITDGFTIESLFGNIERVKVDDGDLAGSGDLAGTLRANNGWIEDVHLKGSDMLSTASIIGLWADTLEFDGNIENGALIDITYGVEDIEVGGSINGATLNIGWLESLDVDGDVTGVFNFGFHPDDTSIDIGGDWTITGHSFIDAEVDIDVEGNLTAVGSARLRLGGYVDDFVVEGSVTDIDILIDGAADDIEFGSMTDVVMTLAHSVDNIEIEGDMTRSLIQLGISAGDDGVFADNVDAKDANETSRMAMLDDFEVMNMVDSILAVGGAIDDLDLFSMDSSSISSGLVLGSLAIRDVIDDATPLASTAEQNAARSGGDLVLFHGSIDGVTIDDDALTGILDSYVTAGVTPGVAGDFVGSSVAVSLTGGRSIIDDVDIEFSSGVAGNSLVLTDAGIDNNDIATAGVTTGTVTYDVVADLRGGLAFETNQGFADDDNDLVIVTGLGTLLIEVNGDGTVTVYDDDPSDGVLDTVVISGTDDSSDVTIEGLGQFDIARLVTTDDVALDDFEFDGDLLGDGDDAVVDLWFDGPIDDFMIRGLGSNATGPAQTANNVTGQIGGDIDDMVIGDQGSVQLRIGGEVDDLEIAMGSGTALQNTLANYAGSFYNTLTYDAAGNLWAHVGGGVLHRLDPNTPGGVLETINVTDAYTGNVPELLGIDFLGADMYGLARLYDPQPTQVVGTINAGAGATLDGLAVTDDGTIYAVNSNTGTAQLVTIDPDTGDQTVVGELRNTIGGNSSYDATHVLSLAIDDSGNLIALVSDRDGDGGFDGAEVAIVEIQTTAVGGFVAVHQIDNAIAKGVLLDGGGVTDLFKGMAVTSGGTIYAIRDDAGDDTLVTINPATGTITTIGAVQVGGGGVGVTDIKGIGFDASGNLVAYDSGSTGRMLYLAAADLADATAFTELTTDDTLVLDTLDAFAIGGAGANYASYAYNTDADGTLYANPAESDGLVGVLGMIDTTGVTDEFTRVSTVLDDTNSNAPVPFTAADTSVAIAADGGVVYLVGPDSDGNAQLIGYTVGTETMAVVGELLDSSGRNIDVDAMDFDTSGVPMLVGLNTDEQRFYTIDAATGDLVPRTDRGVVASGLTGLTYDATGDSFFSFQNGTVESFVQFRGTTNADVGGIIANSIDDLEIGSPYFNRIVTTGNTFTDVDIEGDFDGTLVTDGNLGKLRHDDGEFRGIIDVAGNIDKKLVFDMSVTDQARITVGGFLDDLRMREGTFGGILTAMFADRIRIDGDVAADASINVTYVIDDFRVDDDGVFLGAASFGRIDDVRIEGLFGDGAALEITNYADRVRLQGGTHANSSLTIGGNADRIQTDEIHAGVIVVNLALERADFEFVTGGQLYVGGNSERLEVDEHVTDGVFIYGVMFGADGIFNTSDDVLAGATLERAGFDDNFTDSILAVGVLPAEAQGPGLPADHRAFIRDVGSAGTLVTNAAEAGGLRLSRIERLDIERVIHTSLADETSQPLVVTADGIDRFDVDHGEHFLTLQTLNDPFGPPQIVEVGSPADNEIRIVLSEPLNTDSLILAETIDQLDATVFVYDSSNEVISGLTMVYSEQTQPNGDVYGIITVYRNIAFGEDVNITLRGSMIHPFNPADIDGPVIMDRGGLRSGLQLVGDPLGAVLDGNGDGVGGDNYGLVVSAVDAADDFDLDPTALNLGGAPSQLTLAQTFDDFFDVDIYTFAGTAGEYFSVEYTGASDSRMGVFYRDDQGTVGDETDDTFELLARWEDASYDVTMFQAFELPVTSDYYVAVTPDDTNFTSGASYALTVSLAADDAALAAMVDGTLTAGPVANQIDFGGGNVQDIAYVSNSERVSKQLVYLNFDGGQSTETDQGTVDFETFDAADLDASLAGMTDTLLNGGAGVTGILDNILSIFDVGSYLPNLPGVGGLNIDVSDTLANYNAASSGLFFSTVDPTTLDGSLDADTDFTTIYVGRSNAAAPGLLGQASNIDVAGQDLGDEAIVLLENFANSSSAVEGSDVMLNEYSTYLANIISHELLHTLGFNHQPTNGIDFYTIEDDPDNDADASDSNDGQYAIMAYADLTTNLTQLGQLGTADLTSGEFPVGQIDVATNFVWWFA